MAATVTGAQALPLCKSGNVAFQQDPVNPVLSSAPIRPRRGVIVLYGYGSCVRVERGHLIVEDGVGSDRYKGRFPRVGHGLVRLFTGFAHYDGSIDPNFTGAPPTLTSYGFDFPSAPDSLSDFKWVFAQRHAIGQPLFIDLMYVDYSYPGASFDITGNIFETILPYAETATSVGYYIGETGTVAYSYTADPPSSVPEPASLFLVGTGLITAFNLRRVLKKKHI